MNSQVTPAQLDRDELRSRIRAKYTDVAQEPEQGFHFHTGRPLARMLGYDNAEGKGHHRHEWGRQEPFEFETLEKLVERFLKESGEIRSSGS